MNGDEVSSVVGTDDMGFYYFDFIASTVGASSLVNGTSLSTPTGSIVSQGWRVEPRRESETYSTREEPVLRITNTINDTRDMTAVATSVRVTYTSTPLVRQIQEFFESDDERSPSEDTLARRMPPAVVHLSLYYRPSTTSGLPAESTAEDALEAKIRETTSGVSATELSNVVEALDASEVTYPFFVVVEYQGKRRGGKDGFGRFLSFRSGNGTILPDNFVESVSQSYRFAHFIPGNINTIRETD
jgi:hypothetical protein